MSGQLPTLDLAGARVRSRSLYLHQLRRIGEESGFCHVVGHGIDVAQLTGVIELARRFFALPEADRQTIDIEASPHFRGYSGVQLGRAGAGTGRRDRLDVGAERSAATRAGGDPDWQILEGPNQWPTSLRELRPALIDWMDRMTVLARQLVRDLLAAVGAPASSLDPVMDVPHVHLKLLHYLGAEERVEGVGAHRDDCLLTLLLQDEVGGLEVALPDGRRVVVEPDPGALVMNIGTMLTTVTGGRLQAAVHRVVSPPAGVDRYSVPFFFGPRLDAVVAPVLAGGRDQQPVAYGEMVLAGVVHALPHIVRRHHPDLLRTTE